MMPAATCPWGRATVTRQWAAAAMRPDPEMAALGRWSPRISQRWRTFKLSNDPAFAEKLQDIVGLYVSPPAHTVVLSVDEEEPDPGARISRHCHQEFIRFLNALERDIPAGTIMDNYPSTISAPSPSSGAPTQTRHHRRPQQRAPTLESNH